MNILSLFDGMACGYLAMQNADVEIDRYVAFEIDKYAVQTAQHNFPLIEEKGNVFHADFREYAGFDFLIGGSPCTYWSIAQTKNRETTASGLGWELFSQYVRALQEANPKYFIYENNKSMSKEIRKSISETFGFEPICINSALVSAQNRQRLYWVGIRQPDGTYKKAEVLQPTDRGILLKDIIDGHYYDLTSNDKAYTLTASYSGACPWNTIERHQRNMVVRPIEYNPSEKAEIIVNDRAIRAATKAGTIQGTYVYTQNTEKSNAVISGHAHEEKILVPVCVASRGRNPENPSDRTAGVPTEQRLEARTDGKTNTLTTVQKDNLIMNPVRVGTYPSNVKNPEYDSQAYRVYSSEGKSVTLVGNGGGAGAKTGLYAIPEKLDSKTDFPIYEVKDGKITIKEKSYPIKLKDGFYIIRKLTVEECKRLQTVPKWYQFPVSNAQVYKMLGNGWTVEVIAHLIRSALDDNYVPKSEDGEFEQLTFYNGEKI